MGLVCISGGQWVDCSRENNAHSERSSLDSWMLFFETLFWKRVFAGRHHSSWAESRCLIQEGSIHTCAIFVDAYTYRHRRKTKGNCGRNTEERRRQKKTDRDWSDAVTIEGMGAATKYFSESERGKYIICRPFEETKSHQIIDLVLKYDVRKQVCFCDMPLGQSTMLSFYRRKELG